jgi:hypothetical protein
VCKEAHNYKVAEVGVKLMGVIADDPGQLHACRSLFFWDPLHKLHTTLGKLCDT